MEEHKGSTKKSLLTLLTIVAGLVLILSSGRTSAQTGAAWTTLFDGKNLSQWNPIGNANWKIGPDGVEANMGTGFLVSKAMYGDFELRAELWVTDDANSGIFIRAENPAEITAMNAYEVNIFDKRPDQAYRTGGIVDIAKPAVMVNAGNKWNTLEITAKGSHFTVRLNGMTTVNDIVDTKRARGAIALQYGAGTVKFRSVQIRQ
jgi:hypothetical protein